MNKGYLALEDGRVFEGNIISGEFTTGEIVFNTSLTGYQEILSDPSYCGQIITMTYPHIGNYGTTPEDDESRSIFSSGLVVKEFASMHSNWRAQSSLVDYLPKKDFVIIDDIDTRALTKHIRSRGAMRAAMGPASKFTKEALVNEANKAQKMEGLDLATKVSIPELYVEGLDNTGFHVVAFDYGIKSNIVKMLVELGCYVEVVPAATTAEEILAKLPDGVFLSNGPGDPAAVGYAVDTIKRLLGKVPIFGICLGHQLLSLALGLTTFKLKFGHRGGNHPVKNLQTGKVEITSQNHGFAVDSSQFAVNGSGEMHLLSTVNGQQPKVELTHINLNDNTVEGIKAEKLSAFSVQYHPEAAPGPHDSQYLFDEFIGLMKKAGVR